MDISSIRTSKLVVPVDDRRDHIRGPSKAPVTLVEYGDYECPYCALAHHTVKEVQAQVEDEMRFVFRNFPLTAIHPHALHAAEATEAAAIQEKFWEMHDLLFETQPHFEDADLIADAESLGLDSNQFMIDLAKHIYVPKIDHDFRAGIRSGVNGTPSFFINGIRYNGGYDQESLLTAVASTLR